MSSSPPSSPPAIIIILLCLSAPAALPFFTRPSEAAQNWNEGASCPSSETPPNHRLVLRCTAVHRGPPTATAGVLLTSVCEDPLNLPGRRRGDTPLTPDAILLNADHEPALSVCLSVQQSVSYVSVCLLHWLSICTKCHSIITFLQTFALTAINPHDVIADYVHMHAIIQLV